MPGLLGSDEVHVRLDALLPAERTIIQTILVSSRQREREDVRPSLPQIAFTEAAAHLLALPPYSLTPRELEVLALLFDNKSNKQVARLLGISPRTVEVHRSRVLEKLGTRTAVGMTKFVMAIITATQQS